MLYIIVLSILTKVNEGGYMYKLKYHASWCVSCKNCQEYIPGCLETFKRSPGLSVLISEDNYRKHQEEIFGMLDECPVEALTIEFYKG